MILRLDRLMTSLPAAKDPSPNAAAAVQELLGGKFGEMSTLMNYTYPTARALTGFLLVRGGVHIVAYAKALEKMSGVAVGKLLPIPDISNKRFPESKKHEDRGLHCILYRFSPDDYRRISEIWNGEHPEDGQPLEVQDGPPEGAIPPDLDPEPQLASPVGPDTADLDPVMLEEYARRIFGPEINDDIKRQKDGNGRRQTGRKTQSAS